MKTIIATIYIEIDDSIAPEEFVSNFEEVIDATLINSTLPIETYSTEYSTTIPNPSTKDIVILTGAEDA